MEVITHQQGLSTAKSDTRKGGNWAWGSAQRRATNTISQEMKIIPPCTYLAQLTTTVVVDRDLFTDAQDDQFRDCRRARRIRTSECLPPPPLLQSGVVDNGVEGWGRRGEERRRKGAVEPGEERRNPPCSYTLQLASFRTSLIPFSFFFFSSLFVDSMYV